MTSPESQNKDKITENAMAINEFINEKTEKTGSQCLVL